MINNTLFIFTKDITSLPFYREDDDRIFLQTKTRSFRKFGFNNTQDEIIFNKQCKRASSSSIIYFISKMFHKMYTNYVIVEKECIDIKRTLLNQISFGINIINFEQAQDNIDDYSKIVVVDINNLDHIAYQLFCYNEQNQSIPEVTSMENTLIIASNAFLKGATINIGSKCFRFSKQDTLDFLNLDSCNIHNGKRMVDFKKSFMDILNRKPYVTTLPTNDKSIFDNLLHYLAIDGLEYPYNPFGWYESMDINFDSVLIIIYNDNVNFPDLRVHMYIESKSSNKDIAYMIHLINGSIEDTKTIIRNFSECNDESITDEIKSSVDVRPELVSLINKRNLLIMKNDHFENIKIELSDVNNDPIKHECCMFCGTPIGYPDDHVIKRFKCSDTAMIDNVVNIVGYGMFRHNEDVMFVSCNKHNYNLNKIEELVKEGNLDISSLLALRFV